MNEADAKWCNEVIEKVMKMPIAQPFKDRVTIEGYSKIVKKEMYFSLIQTNLQRKTYTSIQKFLDDCELIYKNSVIFNLEDSIYTKMAKDVYMEIMQMYAERVTSQNNEWYQKLAALSLRIQNLLATTPDKYLHNPDAMKLDLPREPEKGSSVVSHLYKVCGEKSYDKIAEKWQTYNEETKQNVVSKLKQSKHT